MPNWCSNTVILKHKDPTFVARAREAAATGLLNEFIPVPKDLVETIAGSVGEDARLEHETQMAYNLNNYGYANWYDFCVAEWGTKWDVTGEVQDFDDGIMIAFESAWAPPVEAYSKLMSMGFYVEAMYYEPGVGFCGAWVEGEEDHYDIQGNSEWVEANVPDYINDAFGISENMAEWEEEENEEN